ncbi:MAG: hypothetical protein AAGK02_00835 [Pseudomonadota bacterium]
MFKFVLGLALSVGLAMPAQADDSRYSSGNWTPELIALDKASTAARNYAEGNHGVGILIHLGQDVPNDRVKDGDELGHLFVQRFAALGVAAEYFVSPAPDAPASGITYHIAHLLYGPDQDKVHGLMTAWNDAPKVIEQMKLAKEIQAARETE